ncbi:hypothetical protein VTG60DRAFT_2954 [Thermothelomyces hinnuleus]
MLTNKAHLAARFVPGATYCISAVYNHIISTDGSCGLNVTGVPITCVGPAFGECCGSDGQCGSTEAYCGIGNCQFGDCDEAGYTFDGRCGAQFYGLECDGGWGNCCSNEGVCGNTTAECGAGNCQSGACEGGGSVSSTTTDTRPPLSTSTSASPTPYLPSPDGTCGYNNKYKCTDTLLYFGNCCSAAGFLKLGHQRLPRRLRLPVRVRALRFVHYRDRDRRRHSYFYFHFHFHFHFHLHLHPNPRPQC